jgi:multidrug efflux pump subunit AcrB
VSTSLENALKRCGCRDDRVAEPAVCGQVVEAGTGLLFVGIPKGFFPQQDTGMIAGITEASADVSPSQMATLQRAVIDVIAQDGSVATPPA